MMPNCPHCGTQNLEEHIFCHKCGYNFSGETGKLDPDTVLENRYVIVKILVRGRYGSGVSGPGLQA